MKKQVVVIGLGQFGSALIKRLVEKGAEVIAVDSDAQRVQSISEEVAQAYCFDASQEDALLGIAPKSRDVCIVATGERSKEAAIICTALLKQMGAKRIIARANDDLHGRILKMVGADEIVNPESEFGIRYANHVLFESVIEEMSLGSDLIITELTVPPEYLGKTLVDLELRKNHGLMVVAIKNADQSAPHLPNPEAVLSEGDLLVVVSQEGDISKFLSSTQRSKNP